MENFSPNLAVEIVENDLGVRRLRESHRELLEALLGVMNGQHPDRSQRAHVALQRAQVAIQHAEELELQS